MKQPSAFPTYVEFNDKGEKSIARFDSDSSAIYVYQHRSPIEIATGMKSMWGVLAVTFDLDFLHTEMQRGKKCEKEKFEHFLKEAKAYVNDAINKAAYTTKKAKPSNS